MLSYFHPNRFVIAYAEEERQKRVLQKEQLKNFIFLYSHSYK